MKLDKPLVATAIVSFGIRTKSPSGTMLFSPARFTPTIKGKSPSTVVFASLRLLKTIPLAFFVTLNSMMYESCPNGITSSIDEERRPV